ncbi:MAG: hypoxanthine phosphoribosyltransferase [Magnetococcales bacterium]|nr:hypoxanthine phosphoribosyltransferase [Magnetococcales bacterium]
MTEKVFTLLTEAQITKRVNALAEEIAADLGPEPHVVGLFKGAFVFAADLIRAMHRHGVEPTMDFMHISSYGDGTESSGQVELNIDCRDNLEGRQVLVVDDILDSGNSLTFAVEHLKKKGAERVTTCVLMDKPSRRTLPIKADYIGFQVPNLFVVGYGMDYAERYRELPYIASIRK